MSIKSERGYPLFRIKQRFCDPFLKIAQYNGNEWITNGVILVDTSFVHKGHGKAEELDPSKGGLDTIIRPFDEVTKYQTRFIEKERVTEKEYGQDYLRICFTPFVSDPLKKDIKIDGNNYSWVADMANLPLCNLYGTDFWNPVYLLNMMKQEVIACLMPIKR